MIKTFHMRFVLESCSHKFKIEFLIFLPQNLSYLSLSHVCDLCHHLLMCSGQPTLTQDSSLLSPPTSTSNPACSPIDFTSGTVSESNHLVHNLLVQGSPTFSVRARLGPWASLMTPFYSVFVIFILLFVYPFKAIFLILILLPLDPFSQ